MLKHRLDTAMIIGMVCKFLSCVVKNTFKQTQFSVFIFEALDFTRETSLVISIAFYYKVFVLFLKVLKTKKMLLVLMKHMDS